MMGAGSLDGDGEVYWRDKAVRNRLGFALEHDRVYADVVFIVGKEEERIPAHKLILRLSSLVFENLIASHEEQGLQEIKLPNPSPSIFKRLLKFVYTDELEMYDFIQFLKVASDFGFQRLAELSIGTLKKTELTPANAAYMLDIAKGLRDPDLEETSLLFILKNAEAVFNTNTFLSMSYMSLCQILLEDCLACEELTIFKAVLRWTKFQCRRRNVPETKENMRDILKGARLFIRYTCMHYDEFLQQVKPSGVLDTQEYVKILRLFVDVNNNPLNIQTRPRNFQNCIKPNIGEVACTKTQTSDIQTRLHPVNVNTLSLSPLPVPPPSRIISRPSKAYENAIFEYPLQNYPALPSVETSRINQMQSVHPDLRYNKLVTDTRQTYTHVSNSSTTIPISYIDQEHRQCDVQDSGTNESFWRDLAIAQKYKNYVGKQEAKAKRKLINDERVRQGLLPKSLREMKRFHHAKQRDEALGSLSSIPTDTDSPSVIPGSSDLVIKESGIIEETDIDNRPFLILPRDDARTCSSSDSIFPTISGYDNVSRKPRNLNYYYFRVKLEAMKSNRKQVNQERIAKGLSPLTRRQMNQHHKKHLEQNTKNIQIEQDLIIQEVVKDLVSAVLLQDLNINNVDRLETLSEVLTSSNMNNMSPLPSLNSDISDNETNKSEERDVDLKMDQKTRNYMHKKACKDKRTLINEKRISQGLPCLSRRQMKRHASKLRQLNKAAEK